MAQIKSLADILPKELKEGIAQPLDDYLGKPVVVHSCREVKGQNGVYMRFVCSLPGEEEQFYLSTGGSQPVEVLRYLKENRLFPVQMTFERVGRAIIAK